MVNIIDINKSLNISIRAVIKNQEMLKFVPDHLKTKDMCKHEVETLPYLLRYVHDWYKTQQMYDKTILKNNGTLKSIPGFYENQKICNKAVDN